MLVWVTRLLHFLWRNLADSLAPSARLKLSPAVAPLRRRVGRRPLRRRVIEH
jgi:hypothetical protein